MCSETASFCRELRRVALCARCGAEIDHTVSLWFQMDCADQTDQKGCAGVVGSDNGGSLEMV